MVLPIYLELQKMVHCLHLVKLSILQAFNILLYLLCLEIHPWPFNLTIEWKIFQTMLNYFGIDVDLLFICSHNFTVSNSRKSFSIDWPSCMNYFDSGGRILFGCKASFFPHHSDYILRWWCYFCVGVDTARSKSRGCQQACKSNHILSALHSRCNGGNILCFGSHLYVAQGSNSTQR